MFPLSDSPNSTRTPFVTYLLIAVNVLVFLAFTLPMSGQQASPADPRVSAYVSALRESLPPGVPCAR
jgi:ABC-type transport system involved in cytochrome c biogenesis permease subunit